MQKLIAIAVDDEEPALEIIDTFSRQSGLVELRRVFTKQGEARLYLEQHPVDLIFLDIHMPSGSGIEFIKNIEQNPMVVFTTGYSEHAVDGFELNAVDFLLKPYTISRFERAVQRAAELYKFYQQVCPVEKKYLFFRVDYSMVKVSPDDILFIEGLDNYSKIHLDGQKPLVVRLTMKAILERLPSNEFARVHRSYIVSLKRVKSVRNRSIQVGNEDIPLATSYESRFYGLFDE